MPAEGHVLTYLQDLLFAEGLIPETRSTPEPEGGGAAERLFVVLVGALKCFSSETTPRTGAAERMPVGLAHASWFR